MRRDNRQDRRDDRGPAAGGGGGKSHYQMREKMISIGDDFWIENDHGQKIFKVDGKALRVRQTLILEDAQGKALYQIQERMLRVKDSMEVEDARGAQVAMVKKAMITPIRDRWTVKIKGGPVSRGPGQYPRPRIHHRRRPRQDRRGLQEVVQDTRHLRRGDRPRSGRRVDPGRDCLHRPDEPALTITASESNCDRLAEAYVRCPGEFVLRLTG